MQEQEEKHIYSDRWPERWARANKTWSRWRKDAEKGKFPKPTNLLKTCGYCEEHGAIFREKDPDCDKCTLSKKGVCHNSLSATLDSHTFWLLVTELQKTKVDDLYVTKLISKIADAIKEDKPSKTTTSV